jgi:hypothetical protein
MEMILPIPAIVHSPTSADMTTIHQRRPNEN